MKITKYLVNLILILSVFFSGMGNAVPVGPVHGAMSSSFALELGQCEKSEAAMGCSDQNSHTRAIHDQDKHQKGSGHAKAGCCNSFGYSCSASTAILSGLSLHAPVLLDAANVFMFDSNTYISPASKRRIKPPIA